MFSRASHHTITKSTVGESVYVRTIVDSSIVVVPASSISKNDRFKGDCRSKSISSVAPLCTTDIPGTGAEAEPEYAAEKLSRFIFAGRTSTIFSKNQGASQMF